MFALDGCQIENCLVANNDLGLRYYVGGPNRFDIINSTIVNNNVGIQMSNSDSVNLINSIVSYNTTNIEFTYGPGPHVNPYTSFSPINSIIQNGSSGTYNNQWGQLNWGSSNLDTSPQFVDTLNGNYSLILGSPGIDAGNPDLNGNGITWQNDLEDQDPDGTRMDMGYGYFNQGPVINLSSNLISSSGGVVAYLWSTGETTSSITVQPSATTTYTVDVTSGTTTCQSDVTISVNQRDFVSIDSTACDSIQWDVNWLASTGTYVDTLQNLAGCDSIVTLNLTINQSTTGTDLLIACDSLTWIDEITYTASNNTATDTLTNAAGCDSIATLDLTIYTSPTVNLEMTLQFAMEIIYLRC